MIVHVLLTDESMLTHRQAMIRCEEYVGILYLSGLLQVSQYPRNLCIQMGYDGIVLLPVYFYSIFCTRKGRQPLISQCGSTSDFVFVWILRQKIVW